jgi:hypothetical protein
MSVNREDPPELRGPITERRPPAGSHFPEAAGPSDDLQDTTARTVTYTSGRTVYDRSWAEIEKEREADARRYELRLAVERAAIQAGLTAIQAAEAADKLQREAREAADRAVKRS